MKVLCSNPLIDASSRASNRSRLRRARRAASIDHEFPKGLRIVFLHEVPTTQCGVRLFARSGYALAKRAIESARDRIAIAVAADERFLPAFENLPRLSIGFARDVVGLNRNQRGIHTRGRLVFRSRKRGVVRRPLGIGQLPLRSALDNPSDRKPRAVLRKRSPDPEGRGNGALSGWQSTIAHQDSGEAFRAFRRKPQTDQGSPVLAYKRDTG